MGNYYGPYSMHSTSLKACFSASLCRYPLRTCPVRSLFEQEAVGQFRTGPLTLEFSNPSLRSWVLCLVVLLFSILLVVHIRALYLLNLHNVEQP